MTRLVHVEESEKAYQERNEFMVFVYTSGRWRYVLYVAEIEKTIDYIFKCQLFASFWLGNIFYLKLANCIVWQTVNHDVQLWVTGPGVALSQTD